MGRRWKIAIGVTAVAGLAACASVAWQRQHPAPAPAPLPPEVSDVIVDPKVYAVLAKARQRVLDEPQSETAWSELGLLFRAHALDREAVACFAEAARLNPDNPRWPYLIAMIELIASPNEAIPYLRTACARATKPEDRATARLQLADVLVDRNDLEEASQLYEEELTRNPQSPRGHYGLGAIAVKRGKTHPALDHLLLAAHSPMSRQKSAFLLASCYHQIDNEPEAARWEAESARPPADEPWTDSLDDGIGAWLSGAAERRRTVNELIAAGRHREAIRILQEGHPDDGDEVAIGKSQEILGNWAAAEKAFRSVLARNPDHVTARHYLGVSLYFQALATWDRGRKDAARPQFEAALAEFTRAIAAQPDQDQLHLFAGCCLKYLDRLSEAAAECRLAIAIAPNSADAHYTLGEVLDQQGKTADAIASLEIARRLAPANETRAATLLQHIRTRKAP